MQISFFSSFKMSCFYTYYTKEKNYSLFHIYLMFDTSRYVFGEISFSIYCMCLIHFVLIIKYFVQFNLYMQNLMIYLYIY